MYRGMLHKVLCKADYVRDCVYVLVPNFWSSIGEYSPFPYVSAETTNRVKSRDPDDKNVK